MDNTLPTAPPIASGRKFRLICKNGTAFPTANTGLIILVCSNVLPVCSNCCFARNNNPRLLKLNKVSRFTSSNALTTGNPLLSAKFQYPFPGLRTINGSSFLPVLGFPFSNFNVPALYNLLTFSLNRLSKFLNAMCISHTKFNGTVHGTRRVMMRRHYYLLMLFQPLLHPYESVYLGVH